MDRAREAPPEVATEMPPTRVRPVVLATPAVSPESGSAAVASTVQGFYHRGMTGLADRPLVALLDVVASTDPAPGGGSSAALAAALAASLLEMAACLELARETPDPALTEALPNRARELRAQALALADRDLSSYVPVIDARRLPAGHPERAERLEGALTEASRVPLAIAEAATEAAELGARVTIASNPAVRGDALAGVLIAEAAAAAAVSLVELNLAGRDDVDLARARDARRRAHEAREDALATLPRT